ncbi:hypothetical protein [Ectopseudomonas alcaliphila]|uniref:hypothetical protein n=1 Tax=Ectopseudomonas alcaliphila TaxID=101564 RepID=UPI0027825EC6|nr:MULTISPECIES: hypothetical protein [Pseudomonas]MDP9939752.1 hypothetical protein [Pseudomonas sp. 3400]MDR7012681.1 hypothetical protein [Pseudomonas alcaliphila]
MTNDSFMPVNAEEANAFLRKHMDAVEEASLPPEKLDNYTYRMMVPSFDIEGAWTIRENSRIWEAFGHIIEIYENGSISIRSKSGEQWFSLNSEI